MRLLRPLVIVALAWLLASGTGWAQAVAGSQIAGVVRDSGGGVLPGAEITATKTDTGMTRTVFAGPDGAYVLPNLPVGPYQLKIVLQGFQTYLRDGIVLQVNSNPVVDVTLSVGAIGEQITVTAGTAMVETRSTGVGQVIDNERVMEIPLNGRQATELIFLSGLATSAPAGDLNTNKNYPTVTISVAGGQANGMTYIMDGGTHNDPFNNLNLPTPFPDAIQEFKVETSSLPARYGHHAASAVNVVTKSGTNSIRGNVFDFVRNYRFNARNFFAPQRDSLKRNQFGGTVGAPIIKDKVFVFAGYQGRIEKSNPAETVSFVPTQAMLNGDFTGIAAASCSGRQIILSPGRRIHRQPHRPVQVQCRGDEVPAEGPRVHRPVRPAAIRNPEQQHRAPDAGAGGLQHVLEPVVVRPISVRGLRQSGDLRRGERPDAQPHGPEQQGALVRVRPQLGRSRPGMINALHVTYNKTLNDRPLPEFFSPADLGISVYGPQPGFMGVTVTNGFTIGAGATNPGFFDSDSFQIANDTDIIRGHHQVSFGANWIRTKIETLNNRPSNGQFTFNGQTTGLGLADFMLGRMGGFLQGNPVYDFDENDYVGAYIQDEWKARANLTLNAGLRWEPYLPIKNSLGYSSNFDKARFDQGIRSRTYPQAPPGLFFPGDPEFPGNAVMNSKLGAVRSAARRGLDAGRRDRDPCRLGHLLRHAAPLLQHALRQQSAVGRADHVDESRGRVLRSVPQPGRRQSVPGPGDRLADPAVPRLRRVCERTARHATDGAAAVERRRAASGRRLAGIRQLSRQPLEPSLARDRAQPGGLLPGRHDGNHEPASRAVPSGSGHGPVLRNDRSTRRHRASQLPRHAAVPAAAAEGQPERALQLHAVAVQERPGDDGADGADHGRSEQPGSRLLGTATRIADTW